MLITPSPARPPAPIALNVRARVQYTNFTSAQLLDCTSIAFVLVLSRLFLKARYTRLHLAGAVVCVIGMGGIIAADAVSAGQDNATAGKDPLLGDVLCVVAAFLYACSNVRQPQHHFLPFLAHFDITFYHFSRIWQPRPTPHAPWAILCLVPVLIGC